MHSAGNTDRHRLSYTAKGVETALFKIGQVTDYCRWLFWFSPICSLISSYMYFLPPYTAPRSPIRSDIHSSGHGACTLQ